MISRYAEVGSRLADLGAGPGAMGEPLQHLSSDIVAVDRIRELYLGKNTFVSLDLNDPDFASRLGIEAFELVYAVEVIEHMETPIICANTARVTLRAKPFFS